MCINDPVSKIWDHFAMDKISGNILNNGKLVENPKDVTFAKQLIAEGALFSMLLSKGGKGGK